MWYSLHLDERMKLINGRGQIGEELKRRKIKSDWIIYHTWNFRDKSEDVQIGEYERFIKFVDKNKTKKIVFISTKKDTCNHYVGYKRAAELYLAAKIKRSIIIRLPNLLGKGICQELKDDTKKPFGDIEIMTVERACDVIISIIKLDCQPMYEIAGTKISAYLLHSIIQFGKK